MLDGTYANLEKLEGEGFIFDKSIEFGVLFVSGRIFYTGGFDDAQSLLGSVNETQHVMGTYNSAATAWQPTLLTGSIEAIIDFRTDSKEE